METFQSFIDSLSFSFPSVTVGNKDTTLLCCDEEHIARSLTQCNAQGTLTVFYVADAQSQRGPERDLGQDLWLQM